MGTSHPGQVHLVLPAQLIQGQLVVILRADVTHVTRVPPAGLARAAVPGVPSPLLTKLTSFFSSSSSFSFCFRLPPPFSDVVAAGEYSRPAWGRGTP